jgi:hypothetical protein
MRVLNLLKSAVWLSVLAGLPALAAEATFDKTFSVGATVNVYVSTGSGYVHISPGSGNQVHIVGHVKSGNGGWFSGGGSSDDRVKQIAANPPIEQSANEVRIGKEHGDWERNISIDYDITMPKSGLVDAGSGSGDVRVNDIAGGTKAGTGSGSVEVRGVGGAIALSTGSGDVHGDLVNPTMVKAGTGSGSIKLNGVRGSLKADTGSGDIEVQGQPTSDWKLETGSGSVNLTVGNTGFSLDASTGSGTVHSDPPITTHGSLDKQHVHGDINGGGPTVRVVTGSGDVRIH